MTTRARLLGRTGHTAGTHYDIATEATIGRSQGNPIRLDQKAISGKHARIAYDEGRGGFVIEDLDSLNGTALDGTRVRGSEPLGHLNVITLAGEHDFLFVDLLRCRARGGDTVTDGQTGDEHTHDQTQVEDEPLVPRSLLDRTGRGAPEPPAEPVGSTTKADDEGIVVPTHLRAASAPAETGDEAGDASAPPADTAADPRERPTVPASSIAELMALADEKDAPEKTRIEELPIAIPTALGQAPTASPARAACYLYVRDTTGNDKRHHLRDGRWVVGRSREADLQIPSPEISREHAVIEVQGDVVTLTDRGSQNRTFVGGEQVTGTVTLGRDARLRFGTIEVRLVWSED